MKRFELAFERTKCFSYFDTDLQEYYSMLSYFIEKVISEKGSVSIICLKTMSSICTTRASLNKREIVIKFKCKINQIIWAFIKEN